MFHIETMISRNKMIIFILFCYVTVTSQHVLDNIALNKPAYQTDTAFGTTAQLAVDGGISKSFKNGSCTHTAATVNAFWEVDLGKDFFIDHVMIYNRDDCCLERLRDVELYIGSKTQTYKKYGFHEGVMGLVYTFELEHTVFGRWVRITRSPSVTDMLTLCEVQVFGYDNSQYFSFVPIELGNGAQTRVQSLTPIQCAYLCYKTNGCDKASFHHDENMCVYN